MNVSRMPARLIVARCVLAASFALCLAVADELPRRGAAPPPSKPAPVEPAPVAEAPAADPCAPRRAAIALAPALPGVPELEARRFEILARAKAEPVVFHSAPRHRPKFARAARLRERLFTEEAPWSALETIFDTLRREPAELRDALLTDGYLYAEEPGVAALLAQSVSLAQLFSEPRVAVLRGSERRVAVRRKNEYVWEDGPERDGVARLWLFDRVAVDAASLAPAHHFSLGDLAARLGTREIHVERLTEVGALARLRYDRAETSAVLGIDAGRLVLECESVPAAVARAVEDARRASSRRARALKALSEVVLAQVDEGLPFDEPETEDGQQDGKLRPEWRRAYLRGASSYEFNADRYSVFDRSGRPRVPQVCADFIVDSWERMAGTWWTGRGEGRERRVGRLDFAELEIENRRSVEQLVEFARLHPEWFELYEPPPERRVAFRNRRRFFQALYDARGDFQPGDVVAILGPRGEDERLHYHSFFVQSADPVTGMPTTLAANAGRPRIRSWEGEMQNAPRRAIVARIRPRPEWFDRLLGAGEDGPVSGPSVSRGPGPG